jgi:hypothetical protein
MKTLSYNTANEIRIAMMIAIITTAIFATIKVRELQVNDMNNQETMRPVRTEAIQPGFPNLPVADAKLIEEPTFQAGTSSTATQVKELAVHMKTWINNSTYWSDEATANKDALALQMEAWINNGDYWSNDAANEQQLLASQMEAWIGNGDYWSRVSE